MIGENWPVISMIEIQQLFIYPFKSFAGVSVNSIQFSEFGPVDDRCYMLIDQNHRFVTQRSHPQLSQFKPEFTDRGWTVHYGEDKSPVIPADSASDCCFETQVWKTELQVREKSKEISSWFSNHLDELVRLVEFDDLESRYQQIDGHRLPLAFADAYPLLICNSESLDLVSAEVGCKLTMARFRPNVVVKMEANSEYLLSSLNSPEGGELIIDIPCVRCNVPAIDPETAVYQKSLHRDLKQALKREGQYVFGMNAGAVGLSELTVGDQFEGQYIC